MLLSMGPESRQLVGAAREAVQEACTAREHRGSLLAAAGRWYVQKILLDTEGWGIGFSEPRWETSTWLLSASSRPGHEARVRLHGGRRPQPL